MQVFLKAFSHTTGLFQNVSVWNIWKNTLPIVWDVNIILTIANSHLSNNLFFYINHLIIPIGIFKFFHNITFFHKIVLNLSPLLFLGQQVQVFVCHYQPLPRYLTFPVDCWIHYKSRLMMTLTFLRSELPANFH